jgi:hypothetical protein
LKHIHTTALLLLALLLSACQPGAPQAAWTPPTLPALPETSPPTTQAPAASEPTPLVAVEETPDPPALTWRGALPILTADHQGLTFGPGQMIAVFAEGFLPGESIAVSLIHPIQGVLLTHTAQADNLGYLLLVKRLKDSAAEPDALPEGSLSYQVNGAGPSLRFGFHIDYNLPPFAAPAGCGFYPQKAAFNGFQVFFCGGLQPGQAYQLTSQMGAATDQVVNRADYSGLALFPLRQSSDTLSPGLWTVTIGLFSGENSPPVDIGYPSMTVEILP